MRSLTRRTTRLITSAWRAGARVRRSTRLGSILRCLRIGFLIGPFIPEGQIPLIDQDMVTVPGILDQRPEEPVGPLLAQTAEDLSSRLLQRHHGRRLAVHHLED